MKIKMFIFLTSSKEQKEGYNSTKLVMKTFESPIRPVKGDIMDDPGGLTQDFIMDMRLSK
ncbi:hypothetical protein [Gracilibacillus sp. JCM 18860]|uniref:hypothetical protein n=1 Tax=Gracilibacillus sp. JCM 18860 TaxID=1306159 RepID=UPI000AD8089C